MYLSVLCVSENKKKLILYTNLTDWFIKQQISQREDHWTLYVPPDYRSKLLRSAI